MGNPYLRIGTSALPNDRSIEDLSIYHKVEKDEKMSDTARMKLTPLRYGTCVDFYVNHGYLRSDIQVELVFNLVGGVEIVLPVTKVDSMDESYDIFHHERDNFLQRGLNITSSVFSPGFIGTFIPSDEAKANRGANSDIDALCKDIEGQASEAVSRKDYYERWGRHYLFSLVGAHMHQFCNNFKDPGVQVYGQGELFRNLQENLNDIFEKIPAPQPSIRNVAQSNPGKALTGPERKKYAMSQQQRRNMPSMSRTFNNVNSVCVHGKTRVTLRCPVDGNMGFTEREVPISQLKKGDSVLTENGDFATVQCLVETVTETALELVQIGSLQVTPYHPIRIGSDSAWEFPLNVEGASVVQSDSFSVYNLVLDKDDRHKAVMMEGGISSITLGHGLNDDATLKHDYFGTDRVVEDLQKICGGWSSGHIVLREGDIKRAAVTGEICSISVSHCNDAMTMTTTTSVSQNLCKASMIGLLNGGW